MKNFQPFFSHDSNARNDEKCLELRAQFGWEGYGIFWAIIEMLKDATGYKLKAENIGYLELTLNKPNEYLIAYLSFCYKIELFKTDNIYFWSDSLISRMQYMENVQERKIRGGKKGAEIRWSKAKEVSENATIDSIPNSIPNAEPIHNKLKETKLNKTKLKETKEKYLEYIQLSSNEYQKLIDKYGEEITLKAIEKVNNHKGATGRKYKSDYSAILNWGIDAAGKSLPLIKKEEKIPTQQQYLDSIEYGKKFGLSILGVGQ